MAFPILPMQLLSFDLMDYTAPHGEQFLCLTNKVLISRSPFGEMISAIAASFMIREKRPSYGTFDNVALVNLPQAIYLSDRDFRLGQP